MLVFAAILKFASERGKFQPNSTGSVPAYLAPLVYITYSCRLRGIEVITLTEANATDEGILSNRRKGSRDNITRWTPSLRQAWESLLIYKRAATKRNRVPLQLRPSDRTLVVTESGRPLTKSALDTAWQRLMALAIREDIINEQQRFTFHGMKHRGITDSPDKKSGGHRSESMRQRYDHQVDVVEPAPGTEFSGAFSGGDQNTAS